MALEDLTGADKFIDDLVETNPVGTTDPVSSADDHLRGIKNVLKNTFPNIDAAVTPTVAELNKLAGLTTSAAELEFLAGTTSNIQAQFDAKADLNAPIFTGGIDVTGGITVAGTILLSSGGMSISAGGLVVNGGLLVDGLAPVYKEAIALNHIRAGNMQLFSGAVAADQFNLNVDVTSFTWESVGPTGSGADNIWTEMDQLPSNARGLIVDIYILASPSSNLAVGGSVFVVDGATASPAAVSSRNMVADLTLDFDVDINGSSGSYVRTILPLSTNQIFKVFYTAAFQDEFEIDVHYRGFVTD